MTTTERDRARGALVGLALGDALGMPAEGLSFAVVQDRFGLIDRFEPSPPDNPISAGRPAGRVTDDTDQAVIVGRLLVAGDGWLDPRDLADELTAWAGRMSETGSRDLLGPSTERALARLAAGASPDDSGRQGTTNGAAMRIAPVGVAAPIGPAGDEGGLRALLARVAQVSKVTHNTGVAIAGAAAVAAAVSAAVAGSRVDQAIAVARRAARLGAAYGASVSDVDVAARIERALSLVAGRRPPEALEVVDRLVGTSVATHESVPAALALASLLADGESDAWLVIRCAASLGGDSDTIAAMAGAVSGAVAGEGALPPSMRAQLARANPGLDLAGLADALVAVRRGR